MGYVLIDLAVTVMACGPNISAPIYSILNIGHCDVVCLFESILCPHWLILRALMH